MLHIFRLGLLISHNPKQTYNFFEGSCQHQVFSESLDLPGARAASRRLDLAIIMPTAGTGVGLTLTNLKVGRSWKIILHHLDSRIPH